MPDLPAKSTSPVMHESPRSQLRILVLDRLLDLLLVALLFSALLLSAQYFWRDLLVASNQWLGALDALKHRSVFVQIDETFLHDDLALAMQFKQWGELLEKVHQARPAVILVDYHFNPRRYSAVLPGQAERFEQTLHRLSRNGLLVMGLAPLPEKVDSSDYTLKGIEDSRELLKSCMSLEQDLDRVMRDFRATPRDSCPSDAQRTMAAVAADGLGARVGEEGLVLTRGLDSATFIKAGNILSNKYSESDIENAIVVIGSNFPNEDELAASHHSLALFFHPNIKGSLVHALNTEALIEGRVAWNINHQLPIVFMIPALLLLLLLRTKDIAVKLLWRSVAVLLIAELVAVNAFRVYLDAILPALLSLSCACVLTGRKLVKSLYIKRKLQNLFGGLLSPAVFQQCLANTEFFFKTRRYEGACVLVLDLQGYTLDATSQPVDILYEQTNALLAASTRLIHHHHGCVERFRGDGLLAYFGAPMARPQPFDDAMEAATQILKLIEQTDDTVLRQFRHRVRFGISVGEVILGQVGDKSRFDLAVTGLAANRAAHLESLAHPVECPIVVDEPSLISSTRKWNARPLTQEHPKHPGLKLLGVQPNIESA